MAVLIDTSFLYALINKNDPQHDVVRLTYKEMLEGEYGEIILLDYVFDEIMTLLVTRLKRPRIALKLADTLLNPGSYCSFRIVSEDIFAKGLEVFRKQFEKDKGRNTKFLSFTDSILVSVALTKKNYLIASLDKQLKSWVRVIP